uniref:DNA-directed DNA polymerase n=1 Tax=Trachysalambria curvirostris majanivirus TaxID=2984281 RepID=A0A9C7BZX0_9VIRU|nr:MAG: wsv514-like protein [Trachysalambria curvirostris majanivirus]
MLVVDHIGNYNSKNGEYQYFDNASKQKGRCKELIDDFSEYDEICIKENKYKDISPFEIDSISDFGHMLDFEDALIDYTNNVITGINKRIIVNDILSLKKDPTKIIKNIESTLFFPSNIIEKEHRAIIDKIKECYINQDYLTCGKQYMIRVWDELKCGMGTIIKSNNGKNIIVNNRVGNRAFNVFNSHFLGMECHRDFDLLMIMACFLKYNCIWGGGYTISLKHFDYASAFFGKESFIDDQNGEPERCLSGKPYMFSMERATLIVNNISSKARVSEAASIARSIDETENEYNLFNKKRKMATETPSQKLYKNFKIKDIISAKKKSYAISASCSHDIKIPLDGILPLEDSNEVICLRCFLTLFFFDWDLSVSMIKYNDIIDTIRNWMKVSCTKKNEIKIGLTKLISCISMQMGKVCERGLNWPLKAMELSIYQYYTFLLSHLLEIQRWNYSPKSSSRLVDYNNGDMEMGLLYQNMNIFGKTLLLFLANCTIHEFDNLYSSTMEKIKYQLKENIIPQTIESVLDRLPFTKLNGNWFKIRHRGPSVWRFQISKYKNIGKENPSLSLESQRLIPTSPCDENDDKCCLRLFFKLHCRGSDLSNGGELVSDVCNSVCDMQKALNNKRYCLKFWDNETDIKHIDKKFKHDTIESKFGCFSNKRYMSVQSTLVVGEPIISLEITNYRPIKCSQYKNGSLVSNRLGLLLNIRSGSRLKIIRKMSNPPLSIILLEDLSNENESSLSCDRLLLGSKILYYDIETTGLSPLVDNVIITSIGCVLSKGNGLKEKSIFAYGKEKERLKEQIIELYNKNDNDNNDDDITYGDDANIPRIITVDNEFDLLFQFSLYVQNCSPLTYIAGWNNNNFDDTFIFVSLYKYLVMNEEEDNNNNNNKKKKILLNGLFNLNPIIDNISDIASVITDHYRMKINNFKMKSSPLDRLLSCLLKCPSVDMMKILGKRFSEVLPSMSLNTVLNHVCNISNTKAVQKDPIDVKYHLLGYRDRTIAENALVHKYCCKDAYLVSKPAERMGVLLEIIQLGKESNMSISAISSLYMTQLKIIDGAILRALGPERAFMRSCAIRPHSQYVRTLGGHVTTPLAKFQTLHAMDMGSLYPSAIRQNNLDITTVCSHRQIIDCRNRRMFNVPFTWGTLDALKAMDEANAFIMARYRPCDLLVDSWKNNRVILDDKNHWYTRQEWEACDNVKKKYNMNGKCTWDDLSNCINPVTDLGYFPEVGCNSDLQLAALVNDDSHVEVCSLEYLLPFLVPFVIDNPNIISEITASVAVKLEDIIEMLEKDFTIEEDKAFTKNRLSYIGNICNKDKINTMANNIESCYEEALKATKDTNNEKATLVANRLISLCARITRRVYIYDSYMDPAVVKWSNRLINVGSRCRIWNTRNWIRKGAIPLLQRRYKMERVELKNQLKLKAKSEPLVAAKLKVEEGVKKLFMNSIYGVLVLRNGTGNNNDTNSRWKNENSLSRLLIGNVADGVGGGTRHTAMGNQITQISRRIFLNICPSVRHFFPNCIQGYGDTDSVFIKHNFLKELNLVFKPSYLPYPVIEMDLVLREKIARVLQIIINCTTKGIRFNPMVAAGEEAMIIEHERLSIITHTAGKKTYHMIHFKEDSNYYIEILKSLVALNIAENHLEEQNILENFKKSPISRIVSLIKNNNSNNDNTYNYPHNASELYRLFINDIKAAKLNKESGGNIFNKQPLLLINNNNNDNDKDTIIKNISNSLSASKYFAALKLEAVVNAFGNGFLDIESEYNLIDLSTGNKLEDQAKIDDTIIALQLLKVYKKGKFTKKGISYASKLREIQTACLAWTEEKLFTFDHVVKEHAIRCLSFKENPVNYLTISRVNKEQTVQKPNSVVNLPNPTARLINNHLNPSKNIELGEKFLTVLAMSGRVLVNQFAKTTINTLFNLPKKRWDPKIERGIMALSTVKNLGLVSYTMSSIIELINRDCESILKIICWCLDSFYNEAKGNGFNLANNALSYNTGILVSSTLVRSLLLLGGRDKFMLRSKGDNISYGSHDENCSVYNIYDDYEDNKTHNNNYRCNNDDNISLVNLHSPTLNPLLSKIKAITSTLINNQGKVGVPLCVYKNTNNTSSIDEIMDMLSKSYKCNSSVFRDLKCFIKLWLRAREYRVLKRRFNSTNTTLDNPHPLNDIIKNSTGPKIMDILKSCSDNVKEHSQTCKIKLDDNNDDIFLKNLVHILGKDENCLETCVIAGSAALLFNLLYCVFLRREREYYNRGYTENDQYSDIFKCDAKSIANKYYMKIKEKNIIVSCFSDRYNPATDSLVFLAEPKQWLGDMHKIISQHEMKHTSLEYISAGITKGSPLIENPIVGQIVDPINISSYSMDDDNKLQDNESQHLIFRPGFYYRKVVEKMFAALGAMVKTYNT